MSAILEARSLSKTYGSSGLFGARHVLKAFQEVSFAIEPGEAFGLVGESGSGKSTLARVLTQLENATSGEVWFEGERLDRLPPASLRARRRRLQIIFQDPYAALNPRMRVGDFVAEPLIIHKVARDRGERRRRTEELFDLVGLDPAFADRYPHEFSGGQRQRVCIARALALQPSLIVADEPITALDVSIQAQIVNLLRDLQDRLGVAYLFISHDLAMVRYLCHRVAVMLKGRIVEIGPAADLFANPAHAYTRALLSAAPALDPDEARARRIEPFDRAGFDPDRDASLAQIAPGHFVLR